MEDKPIAVMGLAVLTENHPPHAQCNKCRQIEIAKQSSGAMIDIHMDDLVKFCSKLDTLCPLDRNTTATCAKCYDQMGIWWFYDMATGK